MYSALKHKGKPLHKLARQGVEVTLLESHDWLMPRQLNRAVHAAGLEHPGGRDRVGAQADQLHRFAMNVLDVFDQRGTDTTALAIYDTYSLQHPSRPAPTCRPPSVGFKRALMAPLSKAGPIS